MTVSIVKLIEARHTKPLLLVAIDGHSAAGKSTLARKIADTLPAVTLVHTDDFYRVMDEAARTQLDAQGGYEQYYDWQRLEVEVLAPLQRADAPDWWPRWETAEQYYMQTARPHEYADIIFSE